MITKSGPITCVAGSFSFNDSIPGNETRGPDTSSRFTVD
jgi:hypothetical protein